LISLLSLLECRRAQDAHSAFIPAALATSAHFRVSAVRKVAKSCGEPSFGLALSLVRLASRSLDFRTSLTKGKVAVVGEYKLARRIAAHHQRALCAIRLHCFTQDNRPSSNELLFE
jgi:hypothetical protein